MKILKNTEKITPPPPPLSSPDITCAHQGIPHPIHSLTPSSYMDPPAEIGRESTIWLYFFQSVTIGNKISLYPQQPGFLHGILSQMGIKASTMTPTERLCTLIFNEMAIKRQFNYNKKQENRCNKTNDAICGVSASGYAAKQAMVLMDRGLLVKWKQASYNLDV